MPGVTFFPLNDVPFLSLFLTFMATIFPYFYMRHGRLLHYLIYFSQNTEARLEKYLGHLSSCSFL